MVIVLIAGVCGCGKSSVGKALAEKIGWPFEDADSFHSTANVSKMKQGIPLTDEDRLPWLRSLHKLILKWRANSESGILACSALKNCYRQIILHGKGSTTVCTDESNQDYIIVFLEGSKRLIQERMVQRDQHFMPLSLLDSQFEVFEPSDNSSCSLNINIEKPVAEIVHEIIERINEIPHN
ncbi:probable gluconokinase [Actinia tenebrosa]|uniref:Gluconokinase n=1 Tax=Actinia tenebrosa TaxID=6105 RepID=A0A6P8HYC6_ACTTE|nr:probable gluconokinase [Actinia tenebrosa]XP_031557622.1 probable gluconokinase [Actinia tenebrosa]